MRRAALAILFALAFVPLATATDGSCIGTDCAPGRDGIGTNKPVAWDYIADLTRLRLYSATGTTTTYANCPDLFAAAFEPYNVVSGGVSNISANLLIRGSCSATYSTLNPTQYDSDLDAAGAPVTGPYKVFAAMIPTNAYVNSLPVSDGANVSGTSYGLIQWDGVELTFDCDSGADDQTGNVVMLQLGDAWMVGHETGVSTQTAYGTFAVGPTHKGKVSLIASDDCHGSSTQGAPLVTGTAAPFTTATTTVQYWQQGYNRSRLDGLEVIAIRNQGDYNDLGLFFQANNESSFPKFYTRGGGTGVQFSNFNLSLASNSIATGNDINIVIGDPTNGSRVTWFSSCVDSTRGVDDSTKCNTANGTVNGLVFSKIDAEAAVAGPEFVSFGNGTVSFVNSHLEMTPTSNGTEGYSVGAGVCSGGTRAGKVATTSGQCSGGSLVTASPVGSFTSLTFVNTSLGSETNSDTIGAFGVGSAAQNGEINAYGGFWGASNIGGTYKQLAYDSGTSVGNRPRLYLSDTVVAADATIPTGYGFIATGNIIQDAGVPNTNFNGQQGDLYHNLTNRELYVCTNTDGRCNSTAEWKTLGTRIDGAVITGLTAASDNVPIYVTPAAITVTSLGCNCSGTCSTPATLLLEDQSGNATTGTATCSTTGTATFAAVTSGGFSAGETVRFDTTNTPTTGDQYTVWFTYTLD